MLRSLILCLVCSSVLTGCCSGLNAPTSKTEPAASVAAPRETPDDEIVKLRSFPDALAYAKPHMNDVYGQTSEGTRLMVVWALSRMTWDAVGVEKDETTHGKVLKDVALERGKRLCWRGTLIQIAADRSLGDAVYTGLLHSSQGDLYHFYGVGSSGDLVEDSYARFCGVVTGKYSYDNSGGGTSHAIALVGMFDLPENRRTARARIEETAPVSKAAAADVSNSDSGGAAVNSGSSSGTSGSSQQPGEVRQGGVSRGHNSKRVAPRKRGSSSGKK